MTKFVFVWLLEPTWHQFLPPRALFCTLRLLGSLQATKHSQNSRSRANLTAKSLRNHRHRANLMPQGPQNCHSRPILTPKSVQNHHSRANLTTMISITRRRQQQAKTSANVACCQYTADRRIHKASPKLLQRQPNATATKRHRRWISTGEHWYVFLGAHY